MKSSSLEVDFIRLQIIIYMDLAPQNTIDVLLSAQDTLLADGRVTPDLILQMKEEVTKAKTSKEGVFYYSFARAEALA